MIKEILILGLVTYVSAVKIPSFLTPCHRNDHKCALKSAREAIPEIFKGYKPFKTRSLNPFKFDKVDLSPGESLKIILYNGNATIPGIEIDNVVVDSELNQWDVRGFLDIRVDSDYEVSGQLLVLPVQGKGKCHLEMDQVEIDYTINLKTVERNGKHYFTRDTDNMSVIMGALRMRFENLFNGDKALGDNVNQFINENWQDVEKEVHTGTLALFSTLLHESLRSFLDNIPIEEMFLED